MGARCDEESESSSLLSAFQAVKHLFHYFKSTLDLKLTYAPTLSSDSLFTTYSDADLGGNLEMVDPLAVML